MLKQIQDHFNLVFSRYLNNITIDDQTFKKALVYPALNGGKRLRPLLVYAAGQLNATALNELDNASIAIELIHCYSLVHDDLPIMDNDDLRRGKPTCHKAFNETIALLVGDALQTEAFHAISHASNYSAEQKINMIQALSVAAGARNMVLGQYRDFYLKKDDVKNNTEKLKAIYFQKTGALFSAAVTMGALAANLELVTINLLNDFSQNFGIAFQIQDDILDITSTAEIMGKTIGIDAKNKKINYAELVGIQNAKQEMQQYFERANSAIKKLTSDHNSLLAQIHKFTRRSDD